jgi:hypothetical protein
MANPQLYSAEDRREHLDILSKFDKLVSFLAPDENIGFLLHHPDLHANNILVAKSTDDPSKFDIRVWLDWQGATVKPYFLQTSNFPPLYSYDPSPYVEYNFDGFPTYSDQYTDDLDAKEKKIAEQAFLAAQRHRFYMLSVEQYNPILRGIIRGAHISRNTRDLFSNILAGTTEGAIAPKFAIINAIAGWKTLPLVNINEETGEAEEKCPVQYSAGETEACYKEVIELTKILNLHEQIANKLGLSEHSDGLVMGSIEVFQDVKRKSEELLKGYLDASETSDEIEWYRKNWPYQDGKYSPNAETCN